MPTLLIPEVRELRCWDLDVDSAPSNPKNCSLYIEADIGIKGQVEAGTFGFTAITTQAIASEQERRWGRGYLILPWFSWEEIRQAVDRLLAQCSDTSWESIASKLSRELLWEPDKRAEWR
jgi:hypothetical protein